MKFVVEFECNSCGSLSRHEVADLSPGRDRRCSCCGAEQILTEKGLRLFREALSAALPLASSQSGEGVASGEESPFGAAQPGCGRGQGSVL